MHSTSISIHSRTKSKQHNNKNSNTQVEEIKDSTTLTMNDSNEFELNNETVELSTKSFRYWTFRLNRANVSCGPCKTGHHRCSGRRPCERCERLDRSSLCVDPPPRKRNRSQRLQQGLTQIVILILLLLPKQN